MCSTLGGPEAGESVNAWRSRSNHQPAPNTSPVRGIITAPQRVAEGSPRRPKDPSLASGSLDASPSSTEAPLSPHSEVADKDSEAESLEESVEGVSRSRGASGGVLSSQKPAAGGRPHPERSESGEDLPGGLATAKMASEPPVEAMPALKALTEEYFRAGGGSSLKELRELIKDRPDFLRLVRMTVEASPSSSPDLRLGLGLSDKLKQEEHLRSLEGLVANAKVLQDLVVSAGFAV